MFVALLHVDTCGTTWVIESRKVRVQHVPTMHTYYEPPRFVQIVLSILTLKFQAGSIE